MFDLFSHDDQGPPGEKGATGSSDVIAFNDKLLDAFQVKCDNINISFLKELYLRELS